MTMYDHLVIGAGVIGSWTSYHLATMGYKVCVLDQYPLPHSRGSSQGQSRMLRSEHPDSNISRLYDASNKDWNALERITGEHFLAKTGRLLVAKDADKLVGPVKSDQTPPQYFDHKALSAKFPGTNWSEPYSAVYHPDVQMVVPNKAMVALRGKIAQMGGVIYDSTQVEKIEPGSNKVTVTTNRGNFTAKSLIICSGPWSQEILRRIGINVSILTDAVPVCYWPQTKPGAYDAENGFPIFRINDPKDDGQRFKFYYGTPCYEYPGLVKFCASNSMESDPDKRDQVDLTSVVESCKAVIAKHMPYLDATSPAIVERCVHAISMDGLPIVDVHPRCSNIAFGCAMSGIGFQTGPAFGRLLAFLSTGKKEILGPELEYLNPKQFSISRFNQQNAKL